MIGNLKSVSAGLLFLTFSSLSFVTAQDQLPSADQKTCSISGRIRIDGKPVEGVTVELLKTYENSSRRDPASKVTTNNSGLYQFSRISSGRYDVFPTTPTALAPNEAAYNQSGRSVVVDPDENLKDIDFNLTTSGSISGRIADVDGNPVIGEYVSLTVVSEGGYSRAFSPSESNTRKTDSNGSYHIDNVPPGRYRVAIGSLFGVETSRSIDKPHPHYQRTFYPDVRDEVNASAVEVETARETMSVDITVPRPLKTYEIAGQVVSIESGAPVPNVGVGLITKSADGRSTFNVTGLLRSDYEGRFKISNATPGHYVLYPENDKVSNAYGDRVELDVTEQDVKGLKLNMQPASSISGVVTLEGLDADKMRDQIKCLGLSAHTKAPLNHTGGTPTRLEPDGLFRITGVRPGKVELYLTTCRRPVPSEFKILRVERNGVKLPEEFEVSELENVTGLRVVAGAPPENSVLRGSVKSEGGSFTGIALRVLYRSMTGPPNSYNSADLDVRGRFAITGLAPGEYELLVGPMSLSISGPGGRETALRMPTTRQKVVVLPGSNDEVNLIVTLAPKR
jgi:hypothetical protein